MNERQTTLAAFIRGQAALTDGHPHKLGPGSVKLNNEEALLCAEALEVCAASAQVEAMGYGEPKDLEGKIRRALNCHSRENESHTPDFILANYLLSCLQSFEAATRTRDGWHGFKPWGKDTYASPTGEAVAAAPINERAP